MAKFSLSRPDHQARLSAVLSLLSCASLAGLALLIVRHMDWSQMVVTYGRNRGMLVQIATGVTLLLAGLGFGIGLTSAGQRRNDKPTLSWVGFFVGATVVCLAIILFIFFRMRGELIVF